MKIIPGESESEFAQRIGEAATDRLIQVHATLSSEDSRARMRLLLESPAEMLVFEQNLQVVAAMAGAVGDDRTRDDILHVADIVAGWSVTRDLMLDVLNRIKP